MRRLITSFISSTSQQPIKQGTLDHIQDAYKEAISALTRFILGNAVVQPNQWYVLSGCVRSGTVNPISITDGVVYFSGSSILDGEIFIVPGVTSQTFNQNIVLQVNTSVFTAADPTTFSDGAVRQVHAIRPGQWVDQNGPTGLGVLYNNLIFRSGEVIMPRGAVIDWSPILGQTYSNSFDSSGRGVGQMSGWGVCAGQTFTWNGATYVMPDYRGRFLVGAKAGITPNGHNAGNGLTNYDVGDGGGDETITLTRGQMPNHSHGARYSRKASDDYGEGPWKQNFVGFWFNENDLITITDGFGTPSSLQSQWASGGPSTQNASYPIYSAGGNEPHENRPPYYACIKIMKL